MRLAHRFETVDLNQSVDPAKARSDVERQGFEFIPNASVEQFYVPRHPSSVLHFCNTPGNEEDAYDVGIEQVLVADLHPKPLKRGPATNA
jgi:hypothetical protein